MGQDIHEDVYLKLGVRLNENPVKMLLEEPFFKVLREIYTPEEATLGANFPLGAHKAVDLAKQLNRDEKELTQLLEAMADRGLIFVSKTDDGQSKYSLTSFAPGAVDFQFMRGSDTPEDRNLALMVQEFFKFQWGHESVLQVMKDPVLARQIIPNQVFRTITVEKELPQGIEIYPFEKLTEMVSREESFSAAPCYCRNHSHLLGRSCELQGIPEYSCLHFGNLADYLVDRKFGKRITKKECMETLEHAEEIGLVHNISNLSDRVLTVCNCCRCCCEGTLKPTKKFENDSWLAYSNFIVNVDEDKCEGCGDCLERCQMQARSLVNGIAFVNKDRCIGCGNCVTVCQNKSLSMGRRKHDVPPESDERHLRAGA